jgi:hypothetical protein
MSARHRSILHLENGALRYTYECPRGTLAIDEWPDGHRELFCCWGSVSDRDKREAVAHHDSLELPEAAT